MPPSPPRLPSSFGSIKTSRSCDFAPSVQVAHSIWRSIVTSLHCPHFTVTKRMGLVHERCLATIMDSGIVRPQLPSFQFVYGDIPQGPSSKVNLHECSSCYSLNSIIFHDRLDVLQCQYCGSHSIPASHDPYVRSSRALVRPRLYSDNFYKREIHFRNWLHRLQGKERRRVPGEIVDQVRSFLEKDGIAHIHYWTIKNALKHLKLQKYYANAIQIMSLLRGCPLFVLTSKQEQRLIVLFLELREVFGVISNTRVNMLSYPYTIRKLCEHLGWHRIAQSVPMLKSAMRIQVQDQLWRQICESKKWKFKATPLHSSLDNRNPYSTRT